MTLRHMLKFNTSAYEFKSLTQTMNEEIITNVTDTFEYDIHQ